MSMFRVTLLFLLICPTSLLPENAILIIDKKLTTSLQGDNSSPALDYTIEGFSLATPFIELGWSGGQWLLDRNSYNYNSTVMALTSIITDQILVTILKFTINRDRPKMQQYNPQLLNTRMTPSLPSGHASTSAAFSTVIANRYPKLTIPLTIYTIMSAYSQIYVGNHYVSDVVIGIVVGTLVGKLTLLSERQITGAVSHSSPQKQQPFLLTLSIPINSKK